jgi:hypothetical protein
LSGFLFIPASEGQRFSNAGKLTEFGPETTAELQDEVLGGFVTELSRAPAYRNEDCQKNRYCRCNKLPERELIFEMDNPQAKNNCATYTA